VSAKTLTAARNLKLLEEANITVVNAYMPLATRKMASVGISRKAIGDHINSVRSPAAGNPVAPGRRSASELRRAA
jgi:hypothetical protein